MTSPDPESVRPAGSVPVVTSQVSGGTPVFALAASCMLTVAPSVETWLPGPSTAGTRGGFAVLRLKTGSSSWFTRVVVT